ncbi:Vmc-like lipoprotein signal peptide domain-containing protein [Ureaplasma canigenitalium]|uniref:Vmc-like lipoprotein signal peptide domain-containing protein n=1 Tax=Ureaplasma canigenitalium TaxID=42092 RepID=UPI0004E16C09|nr:DUF1410 domain-containing protein [Ureaplasma canigenitalium]
MTKKNKKILFSFLGTLSISASIAAVAVACRPDTGKNGGKTGGTDTGNNPEKPKVPNNPETPEKPKVPETPKTPETPKKPEDGQKTPDTKPEDGKKTPEGPESPDKDKNPGGDAKTPETPESPDKDKKPGGDAKPTPPPADKPGEKVENKVTTITYTPETTTAKVEFEFENIVTAEQTVSVKFNGQAYTMKGNGTKEVAFDLTGLTQNKEYILSEVTIDGHNIEWEALVVWKFKTKDVSGNKATDIKFEGITNNAVQIVVTLEQEAKEDDYVELYLKGKSTSSYKTLGQNSKTITFKFNDLEQGHKYEIDRILVANKKIDFSSLPEDKKSFTTTGQGVTPPVVNHKLKTVEFKDITKNSAKIKLTFDQDVLASSTVEVELNGGKKFSKEGNSSDVLEIDLTNLDKKTTYTLNKITVDGKTLDISKITKKDFETLDETPSTPIPSDFKVKSLQWEQTNSTTSTVTVFFTKQFSSAAEVTVKVNDVVYKGQLDGNLLNQTKIAINNQFPGTNLTLTEVSIGGQKVEFASSTTEDSKKSSIKDIEDGSLELQALPGQQKVQVSLTYPTTVLPIITGNKYYITFQVDEDKTIDEELESFDDSDFEDVDSINASLKTDIEVEATPISEDKKVVTVKFVLDFKMMLDRTKLHFVFKGLKYGKDKATAKSIPLAKLNFDDLTKKHYEVQETSKAGQDPKNGGQQQDSRNA